MLFNIVLIPMQIFFIIVILQINNNPLKFYFIPKRIINEIKNSFNEEYISNYNKKYMLPYSYISLIILILMSISFIFDRGVYNNIIVHGFYAYFINTFIFWVIAARSIKKKIMS